MGGKCTCLSMQSDIIVLKYGLNKICGLYPTEKVKKCGQNEKV